MGKLEGCSVPLLWSLGPEMTNSSSVDGRGTSRSALNPVTLSFRTNTMMLLMKSSRPSGECGTCRRASGLGPGLIPIFQASPPFCQPGPSCAACQRLEKWVLELGQRRPGCLGVAWTGPGASVSFSFLWKVMDKESPHPSSAWFTLSSVYLCLLPV